MSKKNKTNISKIKKPFNNGLFYVVILSLIMFLYLDFALRYVIRDYYSSYSLFNITPFLFSISIFILFILLLLVLKRRGKLIVFNSYFIFYFVFFLINYFHFKYIARVVTFSDIFLAGEGTEQLTSLLTVVKWELVTTTIVFIIFMIIVNKIIIRLKESRINKRIVVILIIIFVLSRVIAFYSLGSNTNNSTLKSINNKDIYITYSNPTKAMKISGVPEYMWRFVYTHFKNDAKDNEKEDIKEIEEYVEKNPYKHTNNKYSGIYENKNILYIMTESIDSFLVTEEVMPTLYKMKNEGINFTNRFAPAFGGGKTFNTEFAMLTGFYQPKEENVAYKYENNTYKYTFPKMFKEKGYITNSIHYNNGEFYNREIIHKQIGFTNHYNDLNKKYNKDFSTFDTYLINTEDVYNKIVPDGKFATLITTMSGHMPYNLSAPSCKKVTKKYKQFNKYSGEQRCLYAKAHETDEMLKLLIKKLENDNRLNDTIIVIVPDHQVYGYSYVKKTKHTRNENLITNIPFIIWNKNSEHEDVNTIMDTADILPTISNMFKLNYNPIFSTGTDVFSLEHDNYVFFRNDDWYDGKYHTLNKKMTEEEIKTAKEIQEKIRINNFILSSDYYK